MESSSPRARAQVSWRVARNCDGGACVRVASADKTIFVGDSKDPRGPVLAYARDEWNQFITAVKAGTFDCLM